MKKYLKYIIFIFLLLIILVTYLFYYHNTHYITNDFSKINLQDINNLMIVAHPDDELLWGGSHLIDDNYLVVCITCGNNKKRANEFIRLLNYTHDKYIMLGYPDKTNNERDNWQSSIDNIIIDLQEIINLKDWNLIVTHNPNGEYGHLHHKLTSKYVTDIVPNKDNLYYFGEYHSKKNIAKYYSQMIPISDKNLKIKKKLLGFYKSQSFIQTTFDHIYGYEEWIKATKWGNLNE